MSLRITRRAVSSIRKIKLYSLEVWGKKVAEEYKQAIDEAIQFIAKRPGLLRENPEISSHFKFYRVHQHFLVWDKYKNNLYLVDVIHVNMNLLNRLIELEPDITQEIEALHRMFVEAQKKK